MRPPSKLLLAGALLLLASCSRAPDRPTTAPAPIPPPDPANVEAVLFLLGDAGAAYTESSPLLNRLQQDVETWSARVPGDSSIAVLVLGDIVYPLGLHPPGHPSRDSDTSVVMAQVRVVQGPAAVSRGTTMYFLAGNHDWGTREDREGFVRLKQLDDFLANVRATTGAGVQMAPEAGTGGPLVVDFGAHLRLLLLDTAWWLLSGDEREQGVVLAELEEAIAEAGSREIVIAAHHPFRSVGPHGGFFPFWETAGARYLLAKSGAILQDLSSVPYRGLERGLRGIFARHGAPLLFVGGHEHSLQVIEQVDATDPQFTLVSGSGSKVTSVGYDEGVRYAEPVPGYMRLIVERGGRVSVFVEATESRFLKCGGNDEARTACLAAGMAAFRTVYSQQLR